MKKSLVISSLVGVAMSAQALELNVYTYSSFVSEWGPGPALEAAFADYCQCEDTIRWVGLDDGVSILNRLRMEGAQLDADVLLGLDEGLMEEAASTKLLQAHNLDTSSVDAPYAWEDPLFVPFDWGHFAWIYDATTLTDPVSSFEQLAASDAKIIYMDPRTSTPGQGLMLWIKSNYGENASEIWRELADNTVTVTAGWWEGYEMFLNGEADYVLSYTTSPIYHQLAEDNQNYKAAKFDSGHYVQVEVAAIPVNAKNPELARQFLNFLLTARAQEIIAQSNWMLPVNSNADLPPAFAEAAAIEASSFSPAEVAKNRKAWIREWLGAVTQ